jgi:hypothetical protein
MLIFTEGGKPDNPEKNPWGKGENQQQTQLTWSCTPKNNKILALIWTGFLTTFFANISFNASYITLTFSENCVHRICAPPLNQKTKPWHEVKHPFIKCLFLAYRGNEKRLSYQYLSALNYNPFCSIIDMWWWCWVFFRKFGSYTKHWERKTCAGDKRI